MIDRIRRRGARVLVTAGMVALLGGASAAAATPGDACRVATGDFCVCCPPSDCRAERAFCPGGSAGLLLLAAQNPQCAVNPFDAARCTSGGIVTSERTSALGVYRQGQRARIELSQEQLDTLAGQLEALRR